MPFSSSPLVTTELHTSVCLIQKTLPKLSWLLKLKHILETNSWFHCNPTTKEAVLYLSVNTCILQVSSHHSSINCAAYPVEGWRVAEVSCHRRRDGQARSSPSQGWKTLQISEGNKHLTSFPLTVLSIKIFLLYKETHIKTNNSETMQDLTNH